MAEQRRGEAHREEQLARRRPAARLAHAGDGAVGQHPDRRPEDLARIIVERAAQIDDQMRRLARGKGVAMHADARARGELRADAGIGERDRIIAGLRDFGRMGEARAIARAGRLRIAGFERHRRIVADRRHDEEIAEIAMAGAREMGVAEPLDRRVLVAIAGGMAVAGADDAAGVGIGRRAAPCRTARSRRGRYAPPRRCR